MASQGNKDKFRKALMASTDKYVKQQGRNTIALNAEDDRACAGYVRIPGPDACEFCITMGAHNDFYHTRATAGGDENHGTADDRYHPYCNCQIAMVFRRHGELVARDPVTGEVVPYDGAEMVRRYDEAGRPTFKKNRARENARRRGERRNGSAKAPAKNNAAGAKLADAEFDAAMKSLADAQSVDELKAAAARIEASWKRNANGRNKAQWDEMSRFAKARKKELESSKVEDLRVYTPRVSISIAAADDLPEFIGPQQWQPKMTIVNKPNGRQQATDYSLLSNKEKKRLSDNELKSHELFESYGFEPVALPADRSANANVDLIMTIDGKTSYWELKDPEKGDRGQKKLTTEGVSKWHRMREGKPQSAIDLDRLETPRIAIDNRFNETQSDRDAIRRLVNDMMFYEAQSFDEAILVMKNGMVIHFKR